MNETNLCAYSVRSHSSLGLQLSKKMPQRIPEKEFDSIGEESSAQYTQSSSIKRENSAVILRTKRESSISKEEVFKLDSDLTSLRKQYLIMVTEKVKVEKELIVCKTKLRGLQEQSLKDSEKLGVLEQKVKNNKGLKKKYLGVSDRFKEVSEKLKEVVAKVEKERSEWGKEFKVHEDRVNRLMKENVGLKQEVFYKEEFCEKLQRELEEIKEGGKEKCVNRAVKTLSELILSKDQNSRKTLQSLESELNLLNDSHKALASENKSLKSQIQLLSTVQHPTPPSPNNKTLESLSQKIETLEAKLDFHKHSQDFLNLIQCQASVIEDLLNQPLKTSPLTSPLLSI